jgi:hypothetical protein
MQWSAAENAGFSTAPPMQLYSPVIDDETYGYRKVNVEAQRADPGSLYHTLRRMIQARKRHASLGTGDFQWLAPDNRSVMAYTRSRPGETMLVLNNLSAEAQTACLDPCRLGPGVPREMWCRGPACCPLATLPTGSPCSRTSIAGWCWRDYISTATVPYGSQCIPHPPAPFSQGEMGEKLFLGWYSAGSPPNTSLPSQGRSLCAWRPLLPLGEQAAGLRHEPQPGAYV